MSVTTARSDQHGELEVALELITGQKPELTRIRVGNARYKVRAGFLEGAKVTMYNEQMYDFMDRLVTHVMPRITEFNGLKSSRCAHKNPAHLAAR